MAQESVLRIVIDSRNAERNARALTNELDSIEKKGDFASKSMDSMSVATRQLAGYMAGVVTVGAAISKMDAYTGMQNRLKLVTESQEQLNLAMSDTFVIAQKSYQSWDSVIQVYQRFSDNAKTLNIDMAKTAELTETVSKAVAISGASTQAAEAALTQFGQALASGVLRGEELNSILEQTPALAKAIAQGMGITIGQLRTVAAEGKITSDVLVKALTKVADDVDSQFSRTDATIAQSFTQLSNATTQFVGEAGQASGAAQLLSGSISTLAQNLDLVANVAILGGVAALTKAIVTQTTAVYGSVTASVAQRAATAAQNQASIAAAVAATNEAKAHLANVLATNAEAQAKYGATAAAARYKLASDAVTQALIAQTAAQAAANTTVSIGARALALVGGPIGAITIGVTALSAGYMYLQSRTEEANRKLEEQASIATKTKDELLALEGAQKSSARTDLAAAFKAQNDELERSDQIIGNLIAQIYSKNTADAETAKILKEVREGTMTYDDAFKALNTSKANMPDIINKLRDEINNYELARQKAQQNADAQKILGVEVKLVGNEAQNTAGKVRDKASAMGEDAASTRDAAAANREYTTSLGNRLWDEQFKNRLMITHNKTQEEANLLLEAYRKNEAAGVKGVTAEQKKIISGIAAEKKALDDRNQAIANAAKASKSAASQQKKDTKESERLAEQSLQLREQYTYAYADREKQIELSLSKEIEEIRKAGFDNPEIYIDAAKKRAYLEKQIYLSQLQFEINEFKMTEEQKLKYSFEIKQLQLHQNSEITKESKEIAINALEEQYNQELALIKLSQETRLFQMREALMSETAAMQERYRLEREQILLNSKLSQEQKQREIALSKALQEEENRKRLNNAVQQWGGIQAEMNGTGDQYRLEQERFSRYGASQDVFDAQMSQVDQAAQDPNANIQELAAQREAIWQEHHDRMTAIESDYYTNSQALQLAGMGQIASGLSSIVGDMAGEQSSAYKAMFAIEKGFAIAQSALAIQTGVSKAIALGFPQNIPVIAQTVMEGAKIASAIRAITDTGFANGGYTGHGGKYEPAGVVHKGEGVLTQEEVKALGGPQGFEDLRKSIRRGYSAGGLVADTHRVGMGAVSAINSGGSNSSSSGGDVNITVHVTDSGVTTQSNQSDQKQLGQMIGNAVRTVIRQEQRQGGLLAK